MGRKLFVFEFVIGPQTGTRQPRIKAEWGRHDTCTLRDFLEGTMVFGGKLRDEGMEDRIMWGQNDRIITNAEGGLQKKKKKKERRR